MSTSPSDLPASHNKYSTLAQLDNAICYLSRLADGVRSGDSLPKSTRLLRSIEEGAKRLWCEFEFITFDACKALDVAPAATIEFVVSSPPAPMSDLDRFLLIEEDDTQG